MEECLWHGFEEYMKERDIHHELSVAHWPQQNGFAERFNRTLVECARTMIALLVWQKRFGHEAVATAAYLRNSSKLNKRQLVPIRERNDYADSCYSRKYKVTRVRFFTKFWLRIRKKNAEPCRSRLRHSGSMATFAAYLHRRSVRSSIIAQQRRDNVRKDWPEAMEDWHRSCCRWVRTVAVFEATWLRAERTRNLYFCDGACLQNFYRMWGRDMFDYFRMFVVLWTPNIFIRRVRLVF